MDERDNNFGVTGIEPKTGFRQAGEAFNRSTKIYSPAIDIDDVDDDIEKSATVSEVQTEELDFTKMISDLKDFFGEALQKSVDSQNASNEKIEGKIEKSSKKLKNKISKMADDYSSLLEKNSALEAEITELKKALSSTINKMDSYESDTALRKSGDIELKASDVKLQKDLWQGSFLNVSDLS